MELPSFWEYVKKELKESKLTIKLIFISIEYGQFNSKNVGN